MLVPVIAKAIHEGQDPDTLGAHYAIVRDYLRYATTLVLIICKARGIGIGIFTGTALLFFIPIFVWKLIVRDDVYLNTFTICSS